MVVHIPHIPITPPAPPSPEAQEVGSKIAELVRLMRQENPKIGPQDIRQGLQLATQNLRPEIGGSGGVMVMLFVAASVALLVLGVFIAKSEGPVLGAASMFSLIITTVAIVLVIVVLTLAYRLMHKSTPR